MGTWGMGPFDSDEALDWIVELTDASGWELVERTLERAVSTEDEAYLDGWNGMEAIAAAAVLYAAVDPTCGLELPREASAWLAEPRERPNPELTRRALAALYRVTGKNSELAELCAEADPADHSQWQATVRRLAQGPSRALKAGGGLPLDELWEPRFRGPPEPSTGSPRTRSPGTPVPSLPAARPKART